MLPLLAVLALAQPPVIADTLLTGGRVWTADGAHPAATAVLIRGDRIAAVGDDDAVAAMAAPGAQRIDLAGRRVLPGLIDAHVHFLSGGDELLAPDLRSADSEEEMARRLGEYARGIPAGTWLTSGTWDHERWPGARLPTRAALDRHVPDHPVFVQRLDGHMAVANSAAIRRARVTARTPDPAGGAIVRDADGEPAGVFKDTAMLLVSRRIPPWTAEQRRERARAAIAHALSLGVTCVHDMLDGLTALATYQELHRRGELAMRMRLYAPIATRERWDAVQVTGGFGDAFLRLRGVKAFADGSLGSTTAWFFAPYDDAPGTCGLPMPAMLDGGAMGDDLAACLEFGLQPAVHAIGDRANRAVLDQLAAVGDDLRPLRPRIEHAQHLHPDDIPRFSAMGVVASMQPYHAADDGRWAEKRIGAARCRTTYAFRSLLDSGATLAFGSDWPVAPLSPWLGLEAAVTRQTLDGAHPGGWVPEQRIAVEQALLAYTRGAAFAAFDDGELGILAPGSFADLVVLDRDPLAIDASELSEVRVDLTFVGGQVAYQRPR